MDSDFSLIMNCEVPSHQQPRNEQRKSQESVAANPNSQQWIIKADKHSSVLFAATSWRIGSPFQRQSRHHTPLTGNDMSAGVLCWFLPGAAFLRAASALLVSDRA